LEQKLVRALPFNIPFVLNRALAKLLAFLLTAVLGTSVALMGRGFSGGENNLDFGSTLCPTFSERGIILVVAVVAAWVEGLTASDFITTPEKTKKRNENCVYNKKAFLASLDY
jgi:hypothetical protein